MQIWWLSEAVFLLFSLPHWMKLAFFPASSVLQRILSNHHKDQYSVALLQKQQADFSLVASKRVHCAQGQSKTHLCLTVSLVIHTWHWGLFFFLI